jgi:hypothetical protein
VPKCITRVTTNITPSQKYWLEYIARKRCLILTPGIIAASH